MIGHSRSAARDCDPRAGGRRAGEHDGVDPVVADEGLADRGTWTLNDADEAGRRPRLAEETLDHASDERRQLRRLQDDGVAGGDRRRRLADRETDREVPRSDDRHDPERLVTDRHRACAAGRPGGTAGVAARAPPHPSGRATRAPRRRRTGRACTPRPAACPSRRRSRSPARGRRRRSRGRRVAARLHARRRASSPSAPGRREPRTRPRRPRRAPSPATWPSARSVAGSTGLIVAGARSEGTLTRAS